MEIPDSAGLILAYTEGKTLEEFRNSIGLQDQVIRRFQIIGEAARRVSEATGADLPEIPWKALIGLRNVLAHEYAEVKVDRL